MYTQNEGLADNIDTVLSRVNSQDNCFLILQWQTVHVGSYEQIIMMGFRLFRVAILVKKKPPGEITNY